METIDYDLVVTNNETGEVFKAGICQYADDTEDVYEQLEAQIAEQVDDGEDDE